MILLHLIINFCGILALIPLTGVPLPLLSYGGSVTINTLTMLFICLRVSAESQKLNGNTKIKSKKEIY
jgi:cell division protein FtsW